MQMSMHLTRIFIPLMLLVLSTAFGICGDALKPEDLYKKILPSVATLTVETKDGEQGLGTGFLAVKEGVVVTAWHVVDNAAKVTARFSSGDEFEISGLIDKDEKRDVALIRIKAFGHPQLAVAASDPEVGSAAYVIGAPKGLEFSISNGLISQIQLMEGVRYYQFSCAASPGNSGGPIVNDKGEVLGVVSFGVRDGQNLNFAIPGTYVLGLDATLPTKPWEALAPKAINKTVPQDDKQYTDNDILDKALANAIFQNYDAISSIMLCEETVVLKNFGLREGAPSYLYYIKNDLAKSTKLLLSLRSTDPLREELKSALCQELNDNLGGVDLYIDAISIAQTYGEWTPSANDLLSRANAILAYEYRRSDETWRKIQELFKISKIFKSELPLEFQARLTGNGDQTGYVLGVNSYCRSPLTIASVAKNGFGYQLGFRSGDHLIAFDDKPFSENDTLITLKHLIKDNVGKRIDVMIIRDGKEKKLTIKIPKEIPKSAIR